MKIDMYPKAITARLNSLARQNEAHLEANTKKNS
jgi:hypothetical protein